MRAVRGRERVVSPQARQKQALFKITCKRLLTASHWAFHRDSRFFFYYQWFHNLPGKPHFALLGYKIFPLFILASQGIYT